MSDTTGTVVPKWYWVVAIIAVLWNLVGVTDYYKSITLNEEYLNQLPGMLEFVRDMPFWVKAVWGIAIAGSIFGSLSLLLRKAWAYPLFIIAFVFMLVSFTWQLTSGKMPEAPAWMHIFTAVIVLIAAFLIWFSKKAKSKGWLA